MGGYFSQRHGYASQRDIVVREDAPEALRAGLVAIARELGGNYQTVRAIVCDVLHRFPDQGNWSEIPNIRDEVIDLLSNCDWYRVYDAAEGLFRHFSRLQQGEQFSQRLNALFQEEGIGWQMARGQIVTRGDDEFESAIGGALRELGNANMGTGRNELEEARRDLSRRPEPDVTGTIQHCMAAMESAARFLANDPRATLGEILGRQASVLGIPRPLDEALIRMWGFGSEMGRHLREGRVPSREEAELLLGTTSILINYLLQTRHR